MTRSTYGNFNRDTRTCPVFRDYPCVVEHYPLNNSKRIFLGKDTVLEGTGRGDGVQEDWFDAYRMAPVRVVVLLRSDPYLLNLRAVFMHDNDTFTASRNS